MRRALRLFLWQAWYELFPPRWWQDGMGGRHCVSQRANRHFVEYQQARHSDPWLIRFRRAGLAVSLPLDAAIMLAGLLWALALLPFQMALEAAAHRRHITPRNWCLRCHRENPMPGPWVSP